MKVTIATSDTTTEHEVNDTMALVLREIAQPFERLHSMTDEINFLVENIKQSHILLDRIGVPRAVTIYNEDVTLTLANRIETLGQWLRANVGPLPLEID
jgi:hypothetical protein